MFLFFRNLPEFRRLKETAPAASACFKRISAALFLNNQKKQQGS
jgi:hypothetical protein